VLANTKNAIDEFTKAKQAQNLRSIEDQVRNLRDWYFETLY